MAVEVIASAVGVPHADLSSQFLDAQDKITIKSLLKQGDILLETNNVYPLSQVITKENPTEGSNWIHSAIYVGDDKVVDAGKKKHAQPEPNLTIFFLHH